MKRAAIAALSISASLVSAAKADDFTPDHLSLVAGYKAAFTCSAHFNAGRTVEQITGDELHRIYPGYRAALGTLPAADVDEKKKRVSVSFGDGFPPRVAQWRPHLGCVQLPSGADGARVPRVSIKQTRKLTQPLPTALSDDAGLQAVVSAAFDRATYGEGTETTALVVVKNGVVIAENYREGFDATTPQRTWSVAKSIAATIIGAAVEDGLIDIDEPAALEAWSAPGDPRAAIKVVDLLHMSSGLDAGPAGNRTDDVYFGGGRAIDHAITRRLIATPGSRWFYANNDTMILIRTLRERMDDDQAFLAYPFEKVLHPIGMDHTFLETDWNGDFILSSQVWTTARDLARLGLLYLNNGVWEGKRILPEGWADFAVTPAPDQPAPQRSDGSQRGGYGAQFWLFGPRHGLPEGTYAALGNRGQHLVIVPERNVLIVRRGFDDNGGARFDIIKFAVDALAALPQDAQD